MNALTSGTLLGCSICWGSDGTTLDAANAAVLFMLVLLVGVLGSFLSFIFYLRRRGRMVAEEADLITSFSEDFSDADLADEVMVPARVEPAGSSRKKPELAVSSSAR